jgi:hypothetical protein
MSLVLLMVLAKQLVLLVAAGVHEGTMSNGTGVDTRFPRLPLRGDGTLPLRDGVLPLGGDGTLPTRVQGFIMVPFGWRFGNG